MNFAIHPATVQVTTETLITQGFNGLVLGLIFALIAIGLSIIFGAMGIINFAHGSLLLIGAYIAWYVSLSIGNFFVGLLFAVIATAFVGIVIERVTLQKVYDYDPLLLLLLTFGIGEILRGSVIAIWGRSSQNFPTPDWGTTSLDFLLFTYPLYRLFVIVLGMGIIIIVYLFLNHTDVGLIIRAGSEDREIVSALGINVYTMFMLVFGLGAAIAGTAGALIAPIYGATPDLGVNLLVQSFVVVVMGGVGSFRGSVVSGIIIGELVVMTGIFYPQASEIIIYVAMVAVLLIRPAGLFGQTTGVK